MNSGSCSQTSSSWKLPIKPGAYYFSRQKSVNSNDTIATSIG